jgi:hypothetical protein
MYLSSNSSELKHTFQKSILDNPDVSSVHFRSVHKESIRKFVNIVGKLAEYVTTDKLRPIS